MHVLYGEGTTLHTSKRMHFIEEPEMHAGKHSTGSCIRQNVCTSLRNEPRGPQGHRRQLAYVKTYALH